MTTVSQSREPARSRVGSRGPQGIDARSRRLRDAVLVVAVAAVLGATLWGLSVTRQDEHPVAGGSGWWDAGPAQVRLDRTSDRATGHTMPGMQQNLADPVPEGARRLGATITVAATAEDGVRLRAEDFVVSGPGVQAVVPTRAQVGTGLLPEGSAMTVELVYDVPEATRSGLVLSYLDARLPLPELAPPTEQGGHGAPAPAAPGGGQSAPAQGGHPPGTAPHDD